MKNIIISLVIIAVLVFLGMKIFKGGNKPVAETTDNTNVQATTTSVMEDGVLNKDMFEVDGAKSTISWKGSFVSGAKSHTGTIQLISGEGKYENGMVSSAKLVFDMNSIKDNENTDKLITHLKSDDFFSVSTYPQSVLETVSITKASTANTYNVKANLTIKGIKKEVNFPITITVNNGVINATGKLTFNRADFQVKYGSSSFFKNLGDKVIKDEVEMNVNVSSKPFEGAMTPSSI